MTTKPKPAPKPIPKPPVEHRTQIVAAARWGVQHTNDIHYTQDPRRHDFLHEPKHHLPMFTDCSGFCIWTYWVVGAPDPNSTNYKYVGDTETIAAAGKEIPISKVRPGDFCILGLDRALAFQHMVVVDDVSNLADLIVISHGSEQGPLTEHLNRDNRSKRFFQYKTTTPN